MRKCNIQISQIASGKPLCLSFCHTLFFLQNTVPVFTLFHIQTQRLDHTKSGDQFHPVPHCLFIHFQIIFPELINIGNRWIIFCILDQYFTDLPNMVALLEHLQCLHDLPMLSIVQACSIIQLINLLLRQLQVTPAFHALYYVFFKTINIFFYCHKVTNIYRFFQIIACSRTTGDLCGKLQCKLLYNTDLHNKIDQFFIPFLIDFPVYIVPEYQSGPFKQIGVKHILSLHRSSFDQCLIAQKADRKSMSSAIGLHKADIIRSVFFYSSSF